MECERCKQRKGQIQVTRLVEGVLQEVFLCDECLREEMKLKQDSPQTANHMLTAILDAVSHSALQVNMIRTTSCSSCGMTFGMYREIGKMGCSQCYQTFSERLEPVLINWHGHGTHVGKRPAKTTDQLSSKAELQQLHKALKAAILTEAFEEAAKLRDQILNLESK